MKTAQLPVFSADQCALLEALAMSVAPATDAAGATAAGVLAILPNSSWSQLAARGVTAAHLRAAKISTEQLCRAGASVRDLVGAGYDCTDLSLNPELAKQFLNAYGRPAVVHAFLRSPADAVLIAGSGAQRVLGIHAEVLLQACKGDPFCASAVVQQLHHQFSCAAASSRIPPLHPLFGVAAKTLATAGMTIPKFELLGIPRTAMTTLLGIPTSDLSALEKKE